MGRVGRRDEDVSSREESEGLGFPVPSVEEMNTESNLLSNFAGDFRPTAVEDMLGGGDQTGGEVTGGVDAFGSDGSAKRVTSMRTEGIRGRGGSVTLLGPDLMGERGIGDGMSVLYCEGRPLRGWVV